MARISQGSALLSPSQQVADPLTDLTRLLDRLQQTVLRADAERERRLRVSEFERRKTASNISYARSLLTRMEHEALSVKVHSRKQERLADLGRKRLLLDQLTERMSDLEEIARATEHDDDTSEGEDVLAGIVPTPSESLDSGSTSEVLQEEEGGDEGAEAARGSAVAVQEPEPQQPQPPSEPEQGEAARDIQETTGRPETETTQTLRARSSRQPPPTAPAPTAEATPAAPPTAHASGATAAASATSTLLGGRAAAPTQAATTEAILDHQRAEQDLLSESILHMAGELKASSRALAASLEEDREVLGLAGQGLERSGRGLEAAARKMGALRRAVEGKGWWGRMMLYAWVYGLMVLLLVVVFVLPKLRF